MCSFVVANKLKSSGMLNISSFYVYNEFHTLTVCAMPEFAEQKRCSNTLCVLSAQLQFTNIPFVTTS